VLYHVAGSLNALCVLLGLWGIAHQIGKIWQRREAGAAHPAEVLSLNSFAVTFCASWSFFVYGYSIEPFNHVLVWPRLASFLLMLVILYEIRRDRRTRTSTAVFIVASIVAALGLAGLAFSPVLAQDARRLSQSLIVVITVLLVQGNVHQIILIWRSRRTGAVSLRMNQFLLTMDASGILFGFAMGVQSGWPLILLSAASAIPKLVILWLFRRVGRNTSQDPVPGA
jgi:uncharacterized protein with PQ loop repeat